MCCVLFERLAFLHACADQIASWLLCLQEVLRHFYYFLRHHILPLKGYFYFVHDLIQGNTRLVFLCSLLGRGVIYLECRCCFPRRLCPRDLSPPPFILLCPHSPKSPVTCVPCHLSGCHVRSQDPQSPFTYVPFHPSSPPSKNFVTVNCGLSV